MEPVQVVKSVIAKLQYLKSLPVDQLETALEEVNLKMVDLRNRMIERCRRDQCDQLSRDYLKQLNVALSLIFGLAYPVTGFQRNKIEQAVRVLQPIADTVP